MSGEIEIKPNGMEELSLPEAARQAIRILEQAGEIRADAEKYLESRLCELRNTAIHAALQVYGKQDDHQLVIRAARDFFAFLKDG